MTRVFILACLAALVFGLASLVRLMGAQSAEESEIACRVLYLTVALGAIPFATLATLPQLGARPLYSSGRGVFLVGVSILGLAFASLASSDLVFAEIRREFGRIEVVLGAAGRLLIVYLIAVAAYVLTQLESLLRASLHLPDRAARAVFLMLGASVVVFIYVVVEVLVYGTWNVSGNVWAALPIAATCLVAGIAGLRKSFDDMRLPLGRSVVYSSFTLFVLGALLIVLGIGARLTEILGVSLYRPALVLALSTAAVIGVVLWFSPAWQRRVAVFIDENFYVNRHDYRKAWERVAQEVRPTSDRIEMTRSLAQCVRRLFDADVYVGVAGPALGRFAIYDHAGSIVEDFTPFMDGEFAQLLRRRAAAVVLEDSAFDIELVAPYVECEVGLSRLSIDVVIPMKSGGELVGMLLLTSPRSGAVYSPEDLNLLTVVGSALANALYGHLLLREVEERREGETLVKLSAFVLHELKNSVSAMRGLAESAATHMHDPEFRDDLVAALSSTTDRMALLLNRLSQVREPVAGGPAARAPQDVAPIVVDAIQASGARNAAAVRVDVLLDPGLLVSVDRHALTQVFVNLIHNALDAMPEGGRLTLASTRTADGRAVEVSVSDTGCGMSPDYIARSLFRPFSTTKSNGLGIGLYHCKSVVEEHGGHVSVESTLGKGTRVTLCLPVEKGAAEPCVTVS
jgi:putative PEP-CTERM system histidine kinase